MILALCLAAQIPHLAFPGGSDLELCKALQQTFGATVVTLGDVHRTWPKLEVSDRSKEKLWETIKAGLKIEGTDVGSTMGFCSATLPMGVFPSNSRFNIRGPYTIVEANQELKEGEATTLANLLRNTPNIQVHWYYATLPVVFAGKLHADKDLPALSFALGAKLVTVKQGQELQPDIKAFRRRTSRHPHVDITPNLSNSDLDVLYAEELIANASEADLLKGFGDNTYSLFDMPKNERLQAIALMRVKRRLANPGSVRMQAFLQDVDLSIGIQVAFSATCGVCERVYMFGSKKGDRDGIVF